MSGDSEGLERGWHWPRGLPVMASLNGDPDRGEYAVVSGGHGETRAAEREGVVVVNGLHQMSRHEDQLGDDVAANITRVIARRPRAVLLFWFLALAVSIYWAPRLIKDTVFAFTPPPFSYAVSTLCVCVHSNRF